MTSPQRISTLFGLVAAVATIGACSTGRAAPQSGEPPIGAVPTITSPTDIVLPLDAYLLTRKQNETFYTGVLTIGRDCMKRFGLSWPADTPKFGDEAERNVRRYAIIELDKAKTVGYNVPETTTRPADQPKISADAMNVWAGEGEQAFDGRAVPAGGCAGEAVRELSKGAPAADPGLPNRLQLEMFARTKADSRVVRVFGEWSKCLQAKGYSYTNPYDVASDQRWRTAKAGPAEIAVATADVACKSETRLPGVMLAVETAYQKRAAEQHAAELAAIKVFLDNQLANAAKLAR